MSRATAAQTRGMTLIEVMIALVVLAIGVTGAISSVVYSSLVVARSQHLEEASMLAQSLASALSSAPYVTVISASPTCAAPCSPFRDSNTGNNTDITDTQDKFNAATVPTGTGAPDHVDAEIVGSKLAPLVTPLPTGRTPFERFWNVAPLPSGNGVMFAVIVRWDEGGLKLKTVVFGTRFQP